MKAQVSKAQRYAEYPQEQVFEEDGDDSAAEAEEQPDWVDVYEGMEKDFDYDDGGDDYDWNNTCIILPEGKDPKKWLEEMTKGDEERQTVGLELPQVSLFSLNENQRAIVSLVLHNLYNFVENQQDYRPFRRRMLSSAFRG